MGRCINILALYLNEIYFGQNGSISINGIGEASQFYFGKAAKEISLPEAAVLDAAARGYLTYLHGRSVTWRGVPLFGYNYVPPTPFRLKDWERYDVSRYVATGWRSDQRLRRLPGLRGVLHSFSGSEQQANRLIEMGFLMSFGGPITYRRATRLHQLVGSLPLNHIMLETDSPDQPDEENRGRRNEPARLGWILERVSNLRQESADEIAAVTSRNARQLFGLDPPILR